MLRYVARRLVIAVFTLWGITVFTFCFINLAPGDPLSTLLFNASGGAAVSLSPEQTAALRARYGLDKPGPVRYLVWLRELTHGNLGRRYADQRPVAEAIRERLLPTLQLMGASLVIAILVGIPLGIVSALRQYSRLDVTLTLGAFVGVSLPEFFVGIILIYLLAVKLRWLPTSGMLTSGAHYTPGDNLRHLLMPALALGLAHVSSLMRYTRSSVLDVLRQDHVTAARAKGLSGRAVVARHVFRNALLPLITVIGLLLPTLVGGAAIVESIYQWPGMGTLYLDAVAQRDYGTIMGLALLTAVAVLLANLLADLAYAVADPRIRYE
jgi:peptide/nickel transport system permease protein